MCARVLVVVVVVVAVFVLILLMGDLEGSGLARRLELRYEGRPRSLVSSDLARRGSAERESRSMA